MQVLVVDDHPLILEALAQLLPQLHAGTVVSVARDRAEAEAALDNDPDIALVLLDLALPGTRGLDFLADLQLDYPGVPVVVLSATHDHATVTAALAAGARGFIPKTAERGRAVRRAAQGDRRRRLPDRGPAAPGWKPTACTCRPTSSASRRARATC